MGNGYNCYYHFNDHSRNAVATCSKCGKSICHECATFLGNDGATLCPECRRAELYSTKQLYNETKNKLIKELALMVIGFVIGFIITRLDWNRVLSLSDKDLVSVINFMFPFLTASFATLAKIAFKVNLGLFCLFILFLLMFVAPIVLLVRVVKRLRDVSKMVKYKKIISGTIAYTNEYIEKAKTVKGVDYAAQLRQEQAKAAALEAERAKLMEQYNQLQQAAKPDENIKSEIEALKSLINQQNAALTKQNEAINGIKEEQAKAASEHARMTARTNANISDIMQTLNAIKSS